VTAATRTLPLLQPLHIYALTNSAMKSLVSVVVVPCMLLYIVRVVLLAVIPAWELLCCMADA
jgi:hypothetical protein